LGKEYKADIPAVKTLWQHVFVFWDPVNGVEALVDNKHKIIGVIREREAPARTGFTSFQVGQQTGSSSRCARIAIREIALWERRIGIEEAREYYHCNNFEKPLKFKANSRSPTNTAGMLAFFIIG
jgi:hypothetical protein